MSVCIDKKRRSYGSGFTLIETLVACFIFMLVTFCGASVLIYSSNASGRAYVRQELLENARITLDFITSLVDKGTEVELATRADDTLSVLKIVAPGSRSSADAFYITYDNTLSPTAPGYHRVMEGGNELASYISDIKLTIDPGKQFMSVRIKTDNSIGKSGSKTVEPITLYGTASLKYKTVN